MKSVILAIAALAASASAQVVVGGCAGVAPQFQAACYCSSGIASYCPAPAPTNTSSVVSTVTAPVVVTVTQCPANVVNCPYQSVPATSTVTTVYTTTCLVVVPTPAPTGPVTKTVTVCVGGVCNVSTTTIPAVNTVTIPVPAVTVPAIVTNPQCPGGCVIVTTTIPGAATVTGPTGTKYTGAADAKKVGAWGIAAGLAAAALL